MGTSNWQQIPFCIDALMKMAPERVLDIGVGFGRWGIITREFCDVWYSRIFREEWAVNIEGIEGFPRSITDYHASFYNKIHIGDASEILPTLPGPWSVVIFGDVLEHFTKERAHELLNYSLDRSDYVLVNIPIGEDFEQGEAYGNVYERHLSQWWPEDFKAFGLVKHVILKDYLGRPYGSFVLSRHDPKDLKSGLFSKAYSYDAPEPVADNAQELRELLNRVSEQAFELQFIKNSSSYKLANRVRKNRLLRAAKASLGSQGPELRVEALNRAGRFGQGTEVWVLGVSAAANEPSIPWDYIDFEGDWEQKSIDSRPYGRCFMSHSGSLSVRTRNNPTLTLMTHPWSGVVKVQFGGRTEIIDLSSEETGQVTIHPDRIPMHAPVTAAPARPVETTVTEVKPAQLAARPMSAADLTFINEMKSQGANTIAVHCPKWLGVTSSTRILFPQTYPVPAHADIDPFSITSEEIEHHARVLVATGAEHLVFSGGDESHLKIARRVRALKPDTTVDLFWHGSYHQIGEEYVWHILKLWMHAVREGTVRSILTCKAGMEDFFRSAGIPSSLLLNYVPGVVMEPPEIPASPLRAGLWLSGQNFRKAPYAMIAAMKMVGDVSIHGAGLDPTAMELIGQLDLASDELSPVPIAREQLVAEMRRTHVSLYVTLSECCPMLPLESMQAGVPCLIGPCSHLFDDNSYLSDRLVVPFPDRADVIATYFSRAVAERQEIIAEFARYAPLYNARAQESVRRWLRDGPSLVREREPAAVGAQQ